MPQDQRQTVHRIANNTIGIQSEEFETLSKVAYDTLEFCGIPCAHKKKSSTCKLFVNIVRFCKVIQSVAGLRQVSHVHRCQEAVNVV